MGCPHADGPVEDYDNRIAHLVSTRDALQGLIDASTSVSAPVSNREPAANPQPGRSTRRGLPATVVRRRATPQVSAAVVDAFRAISAIPAADARKTAPRMAQPSVPCSTTVAVTTSGASMAPRADPMPNIPW